MLCLPEPSFKALWQHLACTEFGSCRILLLHCTSCMSCMYNPGLNCSVNCQVYEALWPHLACTEFSSRRVFVLRRTSCMYVPEAMGRHTVPVQAYLQYSQTLPCRAGTFHCRGSPTKKDAWKDSEPERGAAFMNMF